MNMSFSQYIYTLLTILAENNYHFFRAESKVIPAKQVWLKSNLGSFSS